MNKLTISSYLAGYLSVIFLFMCFIGIVGCDSTTTDKEKIDVKRPMTEVKVESVGQRFEVSVQGYFEGGYGNAKREIIIVTDKKTKAKYLGVTDVGIVKMKEAESDDSIDIPTVDIE